MDPIWSVNDSSRVDDATASKFLREFLASGSADASNAQYIGRDIRKELQKVAHAVDAKIKAKSENQ